MLQATSADVLSPAAARILPFAAYMAFLVLESFLSKPGTAIQPGLDPQWPYTIQVLVVLGLLVGLWDWFVELKNERLATGQLLAGLAVGVLTCVLWRALDQPWASIGTGRPIESAATLWSAQPHFALARIVGVALVVPIIEELFWRSFILRWIEQRAFLRVAPAQVGLRALLISALLFGLEHHLIVAGVVAGLLYGELYRRTGNLWSVVLAHAVTNATLEFWPR
jgi:hypothetical protein